MMGHNVDFELISQHFRGLLATTPLPIPFSLITTDADAYRLPMGVARCVRDQKKRSGTSQVVRQVSAQTNQQGCMVAAMFADMFWLFTPPYLLSMGVSALHTLIERPFP